LIAVPIASLRRKPMTLSFEQAAVIGLTYLAAWLGVIEYARLSAGETLVVTGAGGGVGSAAAQIGKWRGARVIGVDQRELPSGSVAHAAFDDFYIPGDEPIDSVVRHATSSRGADVVFDAVGGPMFEPSLKSLARRGRLTEITSVADRRVSFDLL